MGSQVKENPDPAGTNHEMHFDVATIKPVNPDGGGHGGFRSLPGGKVDIGSATLRLLVAYAFNVEQFQIVGASKWMVTDRYDVVGIPPKHTQWSSAMQAESHWVPTEEQRLMLQALLVERFNLKFHRTTQIGPVYILARASGKLQLIGPKDRDSQPAAVVMMKGDIADGEAFGRNVSMPYLARILSPDLERPVLDQTGLKDSYDFHVEPFEPQNHDIATAIFDSMLKLGLKIKTAKRPIQTIVIDAATPPTPN